MIKKYVRRDIIKLAGGVGAIGLAGCLGDSLADDGGSTPVGAGADTPTATTAESTPEQTATETPTPGPEVTTSAGWSMRYGNAGHTGYTAENGPADNTIRWSKTLDEALAAAPVVSGGYSYVVTANKTLHALDAATGKSRWSKKFDSSIEHAPACTGSLVLVSAGKLHALAVETGESAWSSSVGGGVSTDLTVYDDVVYFGAADSKVYGLSVADGKQVARSALFPFGAIRTPAVDDDFVYVGAKSTVFGLKRNGVQVWRRDTSGVVEAPPTVVDDTVFVGTASGKLYALDRKTGTVRWETSLGNAVLEPPAVSEAGVFVATGPVLYKLEPGTGRIEWKQPVDGTNLTAPAHATNALFLGSYGHRVHAVSPENGASLWSKKTARPVVYAPVLADGHLYVGSSDGTVYSFG